MSTWTYMNIKGQGHSLTLVQGHSDSTFSNFFFLETTRPIEANFIWSLHGMGEQMFFWMVQVTGPIWPPCPYMVKTLNLLLWNQKAMTLKVGMQHRVLENYQLCSNDDPGLTLTYLISRLNLVPYAFVWDKGKAMDISQTTVSISKLVDAVN